MPTQEMVLLLKALETVKAKQREQSRQGQEFGFLTSDEVDALQSISAREGLLSEVMEALLKTLSLPAGHVDVATQMVEIAGLFLAMSLQLSQPNLDDRFQIGDKVRVRFPGRSLIYLGTIVAADSTEGDQSSCTMDGTTSHDNNQHGRATLKVSIPLLGEVVDLDAVHIQDTVVKSKPKTVEVVEFQKVLEAQLDQILQGFQSK